LTGFDLIVIIFTNEAGGRKMTENELVFITEVDGRGEKVLKKIEGDKSVRKIEVPSDIRHIGSFAFCGFDELEEVVLPEGLKTIFPDAFDCFSIDYKLKKVNLPESLIKIGSDAFEDRAGLSDITLPKNLKDIGHDAFNSCNSLTGITLPASLKNFSYAFAECENLKTVSAETGLKKIDDFSFKNCKALTEIHLPDGLAEIGAGAFSGCISLKTAVIPDTVKKIGERAFYGCTNLQAVNIPESLVKFGKEVFGECASLPPLTLPESLIKKPKPRLKIEVGEGDGLFNLSDDKKTVAGVRRRSAGYGTLYIPEGVQTVDVGAFCGINVKNIVLPKGVKKICDRAFKDCTSLKLVFIPASVTEIGDDAFLNCKKVEIYCGGEPKSGWLDGEETKKEYWDDMTDAFNFHRSGGSFDERHLVKRVEVTHNNYNPDKRPVHTKFPRVKFEELLKK